MKTIKFSINNWDHLYSLQQAISHADQLTGRTLTLTGRVINSAFLNHADTPISIVFSQADSSPSYTLIEPKLYEIGRMAFEKKHLSTNILVNRNVFEELRKNLMEYADIDGIHIVVSVGLLCDAEIWNENETLQIIQLDYAMQGDA